jgi:photosynthetic reaction center cytochrome c subunit
MKRKCQAKVAGGLGFATVLLLASGQTGPSTAAPPKTTMTDEKYKNVQVLKGIPADRLIPAMQFITSSLGVECSFCHVEGAPEKDDKKPKQVARKMMQMMFAINQENFEGKREVTCYSCHRGASHPVATPIIEDTGVQTVHETQVEDTHEGAAVEGPSASQIFAKYGDSLGGESALQTLSTRVEKGTVNLGGRQFGIEIFTKAPGKRVSVIHLPNGDNITTYDVTSGWTSAPDRPVHDLPMSEVASSRAEADLQLPLHFKQLFSELRTGRPEKISDRDVYVVSGLNGGEPAAKFYFDERSGLLLRLVRFVDTPLGRNPTQIDYADYRDQGGVKSPFERTVSRPGARFTIQIQEAHDNVAVDDAKFARPAEHSPPKPPLP